MFAVSELCVYVMAEERTGNRLSDLGIGMADFTSIKCVVIELSNSTSFCSSDTVNLTHLKYNHTDKPTKIYQRYCYLLLLLATAYGSIFVLR